MKTVNSISGGKTSAYMAAHYPADYEVFSLVCLDDSRCRPKDAAVTRYVSEKLARYTERYGEFIATAEDDQTLVVLMDLEQFLGREIIWVRGASYDDVINKPLVRGSNPTRLPSRAFRYCTDQMKIYPMFEWWFRSVGERVNMRIGFRFDEFDRVERFYNNPEQGGYIVPVACSLRGQRRQRHMRFDWRYSSFPLARHGITKKDIDSYWRVNGHTKPTLFKEARPLRFPIISNCVGCFHKKIETLAVMWNLHPEKMRWFAAQEDKQMGTWLPGKIRYDTIGLNSHNWIEEMLPETGGVCDSGGCTD